jgi:superfamily I DNA and/or RNA helicase
LPVNETHQTILIKLIEKLLARGVHASQIGIIVPFRGVVYDLRDRLWKEGMRSVEVGTIHTFQGREKDYILFDTVMTGEQTSSGQKRHYSVRPLDEQKNGMSVPRLLNVAFSRSKKELVVLADMDHIQRVYGNKFLGRLLERIR